MRNGYLYIALALSALIIFSCGEKEEQAEEKLSQRQLDSMKKAEETAKYDTFPRINYSKYYVQGWKHLVSILNERNISTENPLHRKILMTLNRKEMRFIGNKDTVIVPDSICQSMLAYSVFPQYYYEARDIPKIIMVSNKLQCYACYEYGRLVRFSAANTGKERTPTFPGRYALVWKEWKHKSSLDSTWVMPFTWNFHEQAGNAFHQFVMPGRPVSHSCVRQFLDDAEWLFHWGKGMRRDSNKRKIPLSGTPVVLMDIFDYSRKKYGPWVDMKSNKDMLLTLPEKPMEVEEALIPWVQIPEVSRGSLRNPERYRYAEDTLRARGIIRPHVVLIQTVDYNKKRRMKAAKLAKQKEEQLKPETAPSDGHFTQPPNQP